MQDPRPGYLGRKPASAGEGRESQIQIQVLDGSVIGRQTQRRRHQEFVRFLNLRRTPVPAGKVVHAIMDNSLVAWRAGPMLSSPPETVGCQNVGVNPLDSWWYQSRLGAGEPRVDRGLRRFCPLVLWLTPD